MPAELSGMMWLSMANPEYGVYVPFYTGLEETLAPYHKGTNEYDEESAYWAFRGQATLASQDEALYGQGVKDFWNDYENMLLKRMNQLDQRAMAIYEDDPEKAVNYANAFTQFYANDAIEKARQIQKDIITNMARHNEKAYQPNFK